MTGSSRDATSNFYFYNTDAKSLGLPRQRFQKLIKGGFAATSGDRSFGEQLGQLAPSDILLMYENGRGVVAVGTVSERWDGKSHRRHWYYTPADDIDQGGYEYRIKVHWHLDLSENPIGLEELRKRLGFLPRGTVKKIVTARGEVASLIAERLDAKSDIHQLDIPLSDICESVKNPPGRVQFTTTRIIRDTAEARRLKEAYEHRCQICCERIDLGNGFFYSEVHHIRPLGGAHEGWDVQENMLVVCPTHHAMLDLGVATFSSEKKVKIGGKTYPLSLKHRIAQENLDYHNAMHVRRRG